MFNKSEFPNFGFSDSMLSNVAKSAYKVVGVEFGTRGQVVAFGKATA
jgi:hypothetical protein